MSGRIAREIALIRELDDLGKVNYKDAMSREMAKYSDRYSPVNDAMSNVLGVNLVDDLIKYPSQLKMVDENPTLKGLAWDNNVWVKGELPYVDKIRNHELAHIGFRHSSSNLPTVIQEIQAEGASYGIGHKLGIPTDVLAMSTAPTIYSRAKQYSSEQIGNMIDMNREPISKMVDAFMKGQSPSGYRIANGYQ